VTPFTNISICEIYLKKFFSFSLILFHFFLNIKFFIFLFSLIRFLFCFLLFFSFFFEFCFCTLKEIYRIRYCPIRDPLICFSMIRSGLSLFDLRGDFFLWNLFFEGFLCGSLTFCIVILLTHF
jgi:hypothetical protein